jgi:adenylate cyclase
MTAVAMRRLKTIRSALIDPKIAAHRGRIVKTTGDGRRR